VSSQLERLVAAINDHPDPLHGDRTPAVEALIAHGLVALPHVLPLLEGGDDMTRLRAQRVLEGVTNAWVRERAPAWPPTQADARAWQELWEENGPYDWRGTQEARREAVALWRAWMEAQAR
jgi:hypothetical protein